MVPQCRLAAKIALLAIVLTSVPAAAWADADSTAVGTQRFSLAAADSILGRQHFHYASLGRRDPFASMVGGEFVDDGPEGLVNIEQVTLVGVMWGETDRFALVEDAGGYSYILRVGDRVRHGSVVELGEDRLVARVHFFGLSSTVVKTLEKERGQP